MSTIDHAIAQMRAFDMPPLERPTISGKVIRYGPKKRAWYVMREFQTRTGARVITGAFGIWGRLDAVTIEVDWTGISEDERQRLEADRRQHREAEEAKRAERAQFAANRARQQWHAANRVGGSPYLQRKQVTPEPALRFMADGTVLVPMLRYDGQPRLMGLQKIAPDGAKRFNAGMAKEGTACRLGKPPTDGDVIVITEGLATALSIRMALERRTTVYVAFDCLSLLPAARILRALYPSSRILFAADDDYMTEGNPGLTKAHAAAEALGNADVVAPVFKSRDAGAKLTDYNDLHVTEGLACVAEQMSRALSSASGTAAPGAAAPGARAKPRNPVDPTRLERLLEHYTFIRGTDTVYDGEHKQIISVANLRLAENKAAVNAWLEHPDRRTVMDDCVLFDPTSSNDPDTSINLFDPAEIRAPNVGGACERLIALLQYLCGEAEQEMTPVTDWVLRWFAYPLQHLGAKMHTAVVFAGPEGTGKNLICGAIKAMYGRYGGLITQTELESQYTDWRSRKLFIIANEVITRQEMRHQVGKLRNLITEDMLPINTKFMSTRYEANHMNLVFLSNELQPLFLTRGDRRYIVIRTPGPMSDQTYVDIADELAGGGADAFHAYLLNLDLDGFKPYTKPPMTDAKEALIELGMTSVELFFREWSAGLLPWPYGPGLSEEVYAAYRRFCERAGERMPAKDNRFWPELLSLAGDARKTVARVIDPGDPSAPARQRRVFIVGRWDDTQKPGEWLREHIVAFHTSMDGAK